MSSKPLRCRFCSKEQPHQQSIINLKRSKKQLKSVKKKFSVFCEEVVDFTNNSLTENMCNNCYNDLNISYNFFVQVKQAQIVLSKLSGDVEVKEDQLSTESMKQEIDGLALDSWLDVDTKSTTTELSWSSYPWSCLNCNASMPSLQELRTHSIESHGVCCTFRCDDCNEQTIGFDEFVEHVREHRPYLKEYCQYCNIKMETPSHIESHTSKNNCTFCGQAFHEDTLLLAHLKQYVPKMSENPYVFDIMLENVNVKDDTRDITDTLKNKQEDAVDSNEEDHIKNDADELSHKIIPSLLVTHTSQIQTQQMQNAGIKGTNLSGDCQKNGKSIKEKIDYPTWNQYPNICKFCNKEHKNKTLLRQHSTQKYRKCFAMKCIDCDNDRSETFEQFVQHVHEHRPYLKKVCHFCNTKLTNEYKAMRHFRKHMETLTCNICGHEFRNLSALNKHKAIEKPQMDKKTKGKMLQKENKIKKKYYTACEICKKVVANITSHRQIHTKRTKDHTCDRCGKSFYSVANLQAHYNTHNERTELCKVCGKYFTTTALLKKHVKSHNIIKPFQCDHCKKFFSAKCNLRTHIVVHMDVKEYACKYCKKRFKNKPTLRDHVRLHTGDRPYVCQTCDARFACWASCASHTKRVHGVSIAKRTQTPHGLLDIDPVTGQPRQINLSGEVEEWTKNIVMKRQYRPSDKN